MVPHLRLSAQQLESWEGFIECDNLSLCQLPICKAPLLKKQTNADQPNNKASKSVMQLKAPSTWEHLSFQTGELQVAAMDEGCCFRRR